MLNRTEVLKRLLLIRKQIYNKEMLMDHPPSIDDIKVRKSRSFNQRPDWDHYEQTRNPWT